MRRRRLKMKKIIFIVFYLLIFYNVALADSIQETKKTTVFPIYINNAKTAFDKDLEIKLVENLNATLSKDYSLVKNDSYKEDFKKIGIDDLIKAERVDIIEVFKDKTDFVLITEIEPIINEKTDGFLTQSVTSRGSIRLKILDVNNNKYLLNESISYKDKESQLSVGYLSLFDIGKKAITMKNFEKLFKQAGDKIVKTIPKSGTGDITDDKSLLKDKAMDTNVPMSGL
jgi:hypothetical protein